MNLIKANYPFKYSRLFLILALLFILVLVVLGISLAKGSLVLYFADHRSVWANHFMLWATRLGEEHIYLLAILIMLFSSYRKSASLSLAGILSIILSFILKSIFSQPRPIRYFSDQGMEEMMGTISGYEFHTALTSMPSGHTIAAFSLFSLLAMFYKNKLVSVICFSLALTVGISRMYLGQHFILDVAAGAFVGLIIAVFSYFLVYVVWKDRISMDGSILRPKS